MSETKASSLPFHYAWVIVVTGPPGTQAPDETVTCDPQVSKLNACAKPCALNG